MVLFAVTSQETIKVKSITRGKIIFRFKGMKMHPQDAEVISINDDQMTVKKVSDGELMKFVSIRDHWLAKKHISPESLLCGTEFKLDDESRQNNQVQ